MKCSLMCVAAVVFLCGCIETHSTVDVNLKVSGDLNVHVTGARQDLQQMTGEAPARVVNPADIGLPPVSGQPSAMAEPAGPGMLVPEAPPQILTLMAAAGPTESELKNNISGRLPQVRYLLDEHVAGESH